MNARVHVIISGKVQGVWFRASTKQKADELGITGWVKNTSDGNVEALFEGLDNHVGEIVDWCKTGPPFAQVKNIRIIRLDPKKDFNDFSIKH